MRPARPNRNVDTEAEAREMRETFQDRPIRRRETMEFTWPKEMQLIGKCLAVVYSSDKWKEDREFEDYKHLAEAPQHLLAVERFLIDWSTDEPLGGIGPWVVLPQPMPKHFAKLAKFLGVQCRVYEGTDDKPRLEKTPLEFRVARAFLGGAVVPDDKELEYPARVGLEAGEPFLFVYTLDEGVKCIITGRDLAIESDGIVG